MSSTADAPEGTVSDIGVAKSDTRLEVVLIPVADVGPVEAVLRGPGMEARRRLRARRRCSDSSSSPRRDPRQLGVVRQGRHGRRIPARRRWPGADRLRRRGLSRKSSPPAPPT